MAKCRMTVEPIQHNGLTFLKLNRKLTQLEENYLARQAEALLPQQGQLELDLEAVNMIDSSAMGLLVRLHQQLQQQGRP